MRKMTKKHRRMMEEMKHLQAVQDDHMFRMHEQALELSHRLKELRNDESATLEYARLSSQLHGILTFLYGKHFDYQHNVCKRYGWTCTLDLLED